ncbi:MAG: FAD-dependent thymidylate synthase, partial [Dehalococcoidales bacterium]|nr:FAD-dependent thymidylate synthase [Dehalococcoidales bacterium]
GKDMQFIKPVFWKDNDYIYLRWFEAMKFAESSYNWLVKQGASPQEARSVLPNSLKTEIVCTANLREWRHILQLRAAPTAHPQMRALMLPLLEELKNKLPEIFEDIN